MDDVLGTIESWTDKLAGTYERIQTAKLNVRLAEAGASEASLGLPNNRGTSVFTPQGTTSTVQMPTGLMLLAGALVIWLALKD